MDQTNFKSFVFDDNDDLEISDDTKKQIKITDKNDLTNDGDNKNIKKDEEQSDVVIGKNKLKIIISLLENIKISNEKLIELLSAYGDSYTDIELAQISEIFQPKSGETEENDGIKIIEGVFDGEKMIGPDGKEYNVPANYASKSKLVEGDILKLTISHSGAFIYKQISPIERKRIIGHLEKGTNGQFFVKSDDKKWRVLTASVTYYKGQSGDEAIIFIPQNDHSQWAALDNVVKKQY
jgi:hypothetical protein